MTEQEIVKALEERANRFFDLGCQYAGTGQAKEADIAQAKGRELWQARNLVMKVYGIAPR